MGKGVTFEDRVICGIVRGVEDGGAGDEGQVFRFAGGAEFYGCKS